MCSAQIESVSLAFSLAQVFGCNGKMDSGKAMDACKVCGGDNTTCTRVSGSYVEGKARGLQASSSASTQHRCQLFYPPLVAHFFLHGEDGDGA